MFLQNRSIFFISRVRFFMFLHVWGELRTLPMLTNLPLLLPWRSGSQHFEKIHAARCQCNLYLSPLLVRTTCRRESHEVNQRQPGFPPPPHGGTPCTPAFWTFLMPCMCSGSVQDLKDSVGELGVLGIPLRGCSGTEHWWEYPHEHPSAK